MTDGQEPERYLEEIDLLDFALRDARDRTPEQLKRVADFMLADDAPAEIGADLEALPEAIRQDAGDIWQALYDGPAYQPATAKDVVAIALATDAWQNGGPNRVTVVPPVPHPKAPLSWEQGADGKLQQKWDFLRPDPADKEASLSPTQKLVEHARAMRVEAQARASAKTAASPPAETPPKISEISGEGSARFGEVWKLSLTPPGPGGSGR